MQLLVAAVSEQLSVAARTVASVESECLAEWRPSQNRDLAVPACRGNALWTSDQVIPGFVAEPHPTLTLLEPCLLLPRRRCSPASVPKLPLALGGYVQFLFSAAALFLVSISVAPLAV